MNKVVKGIILLGCILCLFGCTVKNDNVMTITPEGKVNYSIIIAFDKNLLDEAMDIEGFTSENEDYNVSEIQKFIDDNIKSSYLEGLKSETYSDEKYIGNKYILEVDDINELVSNSEEVININDFNSDLKLIDQKLFTKNGTVFNAKFAYSTGVNEKYKDINCMSRLIVNLPSRPLSNNADEVYNNDRTLVWNLDTDGFAEFSFTLRNYNLYIALVCSVFIVAFVVILVDVIKNKKVMRRKKKASKGDAK